MGSNAIISVLGFIIVFSIVTTTLNKRNREAYQNTYGYVDYTVARDVARNSIQIALRKIDTVSTLTNSAFPITGNLEGGTFRVDGVVMPGNILLRTPDTLHLTAQSTFNDTSYTIKTTMLRQVPAFPPAAYKGAFGIHPDSLGFTITSRGSIVDGYDHDSVGNRLMTSPDSVAAMLVSTLNDSSIIVNGVKNANNKNDTTKFYGSPLVRVDPTMAAPEAYADSFKSIADQIIPNPNKNGNPQQVNGTYGTAANPVIVYCEGYLNGMRHLPFTFQGTGWGILVVHGDLTMNSNAVWHGLLIVYGNDVISYNASVGGSIIIGGVLLGGLPTTTFKMGGGSQFLFSMSLLNKAKNIKNPYLYQIVDWYE